MVPVEARGKSSLLHSLSLLFQLLASQDADSTAAPALARTILDSVRNDGGHLIAVATSIALALHTGRTDLCIQGVFGAGKTRCLTLLLLWIGVTTQESVTSYTSVQRKSSWSSGRSLDFTLPAPAPRLCKTQVFPSMQPTRGSTTPALQD